MNCKKHKHKEIKIQTISKNQFDPIMEDISPISRNNQTNNDISFSMEYDSHQSQFSQVSLETKFDSALTAL